MPVAIAEVKAVTCIYEGVTYPEGKEIKTFRSSSIGPTQQCESEARKCTQSGFTGSFQFPKCTNQPFSDCPVFDGKVVKHGETVNAYSNSAPAFGADCNALATRRYCYNGVLDGDQSFRFRNCIPGAAKNCSVGLVNVFHNSSATFKPSRGFNKESMLSETFF